MQSVVTNCHNKSDHKRVSATTVRRDRYEFATRHVGDLTYPRLPASVSQSRTSNEQRNTNPHKLIVLRVSRNRSNRFHVVSCRMTVTRATSKSPQSKTASTPGFFGPHQNVWVYVANLIGTGRLESGPGRRFDNIVENVFTTRRVDFSGLIA
eukprot:844499-Prorocentrum_minimum.AAC.2